MPELNLGDMTITSSAFGAGEPIPAKYANAGDDVSPPLAWNDVPDGARELVLVVHDPDAPLTDGFTHWVAFGIDPSTSSIDEGATEGHTAGSNTMGDDAYMGPAPPPGHGTHHYFFHLFALDQPSGLAAGADRATVLGAIDGHIIEQARLVGTYRDD